MKAYSSLDGCDIENKSSLSEQENVINLEKLPVITSVESDDQDRDVGDEPCGAADKHAPAARETWGGRLEFTLSVMGYSIGLGNVWRFPYLCYDNGGGAFLIPYFIMVAVVALPIIFLELSLGQFSSLGCISVWRFSKLFKGVGFAMASLSAVFCLYYNIILAYCVYYMAVSFLNPQPWVGCHHEWNTDNCFERTSLTDRQEHLLINATENETMMSDITPYMTTAADGNNFTIASRNGTHVRATEEFWKLKVLGRTEGLHDLGSIRWQLLLAFIATWVIVYLCVSKGVKSSGKAVYFTATFPYLLLVVLLIRGVTLEGSLQGVLFFIKPDFKQLGRAKVWQAAANQVFLSYSPGWGGMHTLASYNKFNNNCYRDAFMFCISCACTSIFSGFVIFSIVGFMAHDSNTRVEDVVDAGYGLAFVVFPEAVSRMWLPQLWSVLFFFMLITLGLDSQFVCLETLITAVTDEMAAVLPSTRLWKRWITLGICMLLFLVGLPLVTEGGIYVMELLDWYVAGFSPMVTATFEVLVVSYIYGIKRVVHDMKVMLGFTPSLYWQLCWMLLSPAALAFVLVFTFADYQFPNTGDYTFPLWADALGWFLASFSFLYIIGYAIYHLPHETGTFIERLRQAVEPSAEWGPHLNKDRVRAGYDPLPGHGAYDEEDYNPSQGSSSRPIFELTKSCCKDSDMAATTDHDIEDGEPESIV